MQQLRQLSAAGQLVPGACSGIGLRRTLLPLRNANQPRLLAGAAGSEVGDQPQHPSRQDRQRFSRMKQPTRKLLRVRFHRAVEEKNQRCDMQSEETKGPREQALGVGKIGHMGRNRKWEDALAIFAKEQEPCPILYAATIAACAQAPDPKHSSALFEAMPVKTRSAYNSMILLLGRHQRFDEARKLFEEMPQKNLAPNVITYGSLITGHADAGDAQAAVAVLDEMEEAGFPATEITCGSAMAACARSSDTRRAWELMKRMEEKNLKPNLGHLTSLMATYASRGDEARALATFQEMKDRGFKPDVVAYTCLLNCLCSKGALQKAEELWAEMRRHQIHPNGFTYSAMIRIAMRFKARERFHELLEELDGKKLPRSKQIMWSVKRMRKIEDAMGRFSWLGPTATASSSQQKAKAGAAG